MISKIKYTLFFVCLLSLVACNNWLKVDPKNRVDGESFLKTTEGYNATLAGIYSNLSSNGQYGASLLFKEVDAMAGYWEIGAEHNLYPYLQYNYKNADIEGTVTGFWSALYKSISQCNHILECIEQISPDDIDHYNLFKGEALGLRAFLHLELLKMYGPVVTSQADMSQKAIAYRRSYDKYAKEFNTYKEVVDFAREDLLRALDYLTEDPIDRLGREGNGNQSPLINYSGVIDFRGARMNKYAVIALLARNEMLAHNKTEALKYANMFIMPEKMLPVRFIAKSEILDPATMDKNIKYTPEIIFSLYINEHYKNTGAIFGYTDYTPSEKSSLYPNGEYVNKLYVEDSYGSSLDYRKKFWFEVSGEKYLFMKYVEPQGASYKPEVCLIRLPEMYYIAAECLIGVDNAKALSLLNDVRLTRGLPAIDDVLDETGLMDALVKEQQKEFFGEGQMFFQYKRWFRDFYRLDGVKIMASKNIFVLPIPDEEYEFSPNLKPTK